MNTINQDQAQKKWVEQIMSSSILIIVIFAIATSYSCFINKDLSDMRLTISLGFWSNVFFYFICKIKCKQKAKDNYPFEINSIILDISFLIVCFLIVFPLFIISNLNHQLELEKFGLFSLFSQFSFFICILFSLVKNEVVNVLLSQISNILVSQILNFTYYIYNILLVCFFIMINSSITSHSKFIFSSFTFTLIFLGLFRLFKLKKVGKIFQIVYSVTIIVYSWKQIQTHDNSEIIKTAYTFLLSKSIFIASYSLFRLIGIYLEESAEIQSQFENQLPVTNLVQSSSETNSNNQNNLGNILYQNTGYISVVQSYLQHLQKLIEDKEISIIQNLKIEQLEKVLQTTLVQEKINNLQNTQQQSNQNSEKEDQVIKIESDQDICSICAQDYEIKEKLFTLNCEHKFHTVCLSEWLKHKNSCPLCRTQVLSTDQIKQAVEYGNPIIKGFKEINTNC